MPRAVLPDPAPRPVGSGPKVTNQRLQIIVSFLEAGPDRNISRAGAGAGAGSGGGRGGDVSVLE
jgi:hypothetical protein